MPLLSFNVVGYKRRMVTPVGLSNSISYSIFSSIWFNIAISLSRYIFMGKRYVVQVTSPVRHRLINCLGVVHREKLIIVKYSFDIKSHIASYLGSQSPRTLSNEMRLTYNTSKHLSQFKTKKGYLVVRATAVFIHRGNRHNGDEL